MATNTNLLSGGPAARFAPPREPSPTVTLLADGSRDAADISPKKRKEAFSRKRLAFKESSSFSGGSASGGQQP